MRTLVIADIHGCLTALNTLLDVVAPSRTDRLITLGDYVDRGPDSAGVLTRLLQVRQSTQLIPIMGNHEELLLNGRNNHAQFCDWILSGGDATLHSYGTNATYRDIPADHWAFMETLLPYYESPTHIFVHATPEPVLPLAQQPKHFLRWNRFDNAKPHVSGKTWICGHTPQKNGLPRNVGFGINLDTCPFGGGYLTCLHVETGDIFQASEAGDKRRSNLQDYLPRRWE